MKAENNQIRIGQLAKTLNVQRFVIRFWEKEFNIKPPRSQGGRRFYTSKDVRLFKSIKELLYEKGYTIAGAKKYLHTNKNVAAQKTTLISEPDQRNNLDQSLHNQLLSLREQLIKLRNYL